MDKVSQLSYLNLGCGSRYVKEWTNVDFIKSGPEVIPFNLLTGIPFPDCSFDVVYHSHILEHFTRNAAEYFIKECWRVLKPGGIMRVIVPDLEMIVKEYLKHLQNAMEGDKLAECNYEWILLELFDQMVRNESGGEMAKFWTRPNLPNEAYIRERVGHEFTSFRANKLSGDQLVTKRRQLGTRLKLVKWILGNGAFEKYFELGKFRLSGEIHQWMYDRYSLRKLLVANKFKQIEQVDAYKSGISNWENYRWLDLEQAAIRKPDSLFMECRR